MCTCLMNNTLKTIPGNGNILKKQNRMGNKILSCVKKLYAQLLKSYIAKIKDFY